jgi:hypothetical protein
MARLLALHQRHRTGVFSRARPSCSLPKRLGPTHLQEWTTSVSVLNAASTAALARNALREAGAPVFLALRYKAAYTPTCHEDRVLCPEGGRNAPATLDILAPAEEERGQLRVSQGLGFECRAALAVPARGLAEKMRR